MKDREAIMIRLRRKVEIIRLDMKAAGNPRYHDCNEMLTLVDMLEREHAKSD
jgi:hypothetical protein